MASKERIEKIIDVSPRFDNNSPENVNPFLSSPAEFLSKLVCIELRKEEIWKKVFGIYIDPYPRDDYPVRGLPALRIYDKGYRKTSESHYIVGDLFIDIILPSNLRRYENQEVADVLSSALMQQFRIPSFFGILCELLPGLNELGREFSVDKDLMFQYDKNIVPLTQIKANFRIDLKVWDKFLEEDDRTKDNPFTRTLGDLQTLAGVIEGLRDDEEIETSIEIEQTIGE